MDKEKLVNSSLLFGQGPVPRIVLSEFKKMSAQEQDAVLTISNAKYGNLIFLMDELKDEVPELPKYHREQFINAMVVWPNPRGVVYSTGEGPDVDAA